MLCYVETRKLLVSHEHGKKLHVETVLEFHLLTMFCDYTIQIMGEYFHTKLDIVFHIGAL